jgi:hypothetical protein
MFSIDMGGCDIVLGADWLRTLGPILMDFQNLTMQFNQGGHQYKFQGITASSPEVISSHRMEKLLKKCHSGVITQLHAIQATETPPVPQDPPFYPLTKIFMRKLSILSSMMKRRVSPWVLSMMIMILTLGRAKKKS